MQMRNLLLLLLAIALLLPAEAEAADPVEINLGFFEAGQAQVHDILRKEFLAQIEAVKPDDLEFVTVPWGYGSASWQRDSCKIIARRLAATENIDIMITFGPWAVEDLLEAGYDRPILAMYRVDPFLEGLIDSTGRPFADNVTITYDPRKIDNDLSAIVDLIKPKKLGLLYFPNGDEANALILHLKRKLDPLGISLMHSDKRDTHGTYAYFKSYQALRRKVDAIYVMPLWGMYSNKSPEFLKSVANDRTPTIVYDGSPMVQRGGLISNGGWSMAPYARVNAEKAIQIAEGALPADLPATYQSPTGLTVNRRSLAQCKISLPDWAKSQAVLLGEVDRNEIEHYDFVSAIGRSLEAHPTVMAAADAVRAAEAAVGETKSAYWPHLTAGYRYRYNDDNTLTNHRELIDQSQHRATLRLDQRIFSLKTIRATGTARAEEDVAGRRLDQLKLDLEEAVSLVYLEYLRADRMGQIERQQLTDVIRNLELSQTRDQLANRVSADHPRWEQEYNRVINRIADNRSATLKSKYALNSLINMPPESEFELAPEPFGNRAMSFDLERLAWLGEHPEVWRQGREQLVSRAGESSPSLQLLDAELAVKRKMLAENRSTFFPTVDLTGSLNQSDELRDVEGEFSEEPFHWNLGAEIRLPLFEGGSRYRRSDRLKAEVSRIEWERDAVFIGIAAEINSLCSQLSAAGSKLTRDFRSETLAETAYNEAMREYDAGRLTYLHAVDALSNLRSARLETVQSWYEYSSALIRLARVVGWSNHKTGKTFNQHFYDFFGEVAKQ